MGREYEVIDDHWRGWIARQPLFFVGSAPLAADGRVNVSPKGPGGSLRVLDDRTVAYLDVIGSGAETIAHLRENGRIVVMFCAFEGPPRIVRHRGCGGEVTGQLTCERCGRTLTAREVVTEPGPGASAPALSAAR